MKITIDGHVFNLIIERKNIKSFIVRFPSIDTIKVNVNYLYTDKNVIESIKDNEKTIIKLFNKRKLHIEENKQGIIDDKIYYLNNLYNYKVDFSDHNSYRIKDDTLYLFIKNHNLSKEQQLNLFYKLVEPKLLEIINDLKPHWENVIAQYGVDPKVDIIVKKLKSCRGYCKPQRKIIAMSSELIHYSIEYIDGVLWHEYTHLKVQNHSKEFHNLYNKHKRTIQ